MFTDTEYAVFVFHHKRGLEHRGSHHHPGQALSAATHIASNTDVLDVVTILSQRVLRLPWESPVLP
jgi:hypothetical protein